MTNKPEFSVIKKKNGVCYPIRLSRNRIFSPQEWDKFFFSLKEKQQPIFDCLINTGARLVGEKLKEILSTIIKGQTEDMKCELLALEIMPDHIHIFIGARPTSTPSKIVNQIKGNTSRQIRLIFNDIRHLGYEKHYGTGFDSLWADGYYCGSAGHVSQESVKRYIQEQEGKKVFDYDIFECPEELKGQLKIGDFFG